MGGSRHGGGEGSKVCLRLGPCLYIYCVFVDGQWEANIAAAQQRWIESLNCVLVLSVDTLALHAWPWGWNEAMCPPEGILSAAEEPARVELNLKLIF